jgi:leader peptidase (prepilin peptidase)/N-methyltransferase
LYDTYVSIGDWPLPEWFWYPVIFGYGAMVGSFLNVLIYRLPLGKHLSNPPSTCPNCNYALTFWDNIPLLSFLSLRGRCRLCRVPISWRYFCVELVTACLWTLLYHQVATNSPLSWIDFVLQALIIAVLVALVFIDLDHFIAPDELNVVIGVFAFGRDIATVALAYFIGGDALKEAITRYTYMGWLPVAIMGALAYAGVLFALSVGTFVYYARLEKESVIACVIRYFRFEEEEVVPSVAATNSDADVNAQVIESPSDAEPDDSNPPRLAMSPAFLCAISAAVLFPMVQWYAALAFILPLLLFIFITRERGEAFAGAAGRFFRSADLGPPTSTDKTAQAAHDDAAAFAKEAETGQHGGMGLGDVKLAIGLGAIMGPGLALLSLGFATFVGAVTGISMAAKHGRTLKLSLPFVPFMAAGAIITMLYGSQIVGWYMNILYPPPPRVRTAGEVIREQKRLERLQRERSRIADPTANQPAKN